MYFWRQSNFMKRYIYLLVLVFPTLLAFQVPCNPLAVVDMANKNTFAAVYTLPYFTRNYLPNDNLGDAHVLALVEKDGIKDLVWLDDVTMKGDSIFTGTVRNHPKCANIEKGHNQEVHYNEIVDWMYYELKEDKSIVKHGSFSDGQWYIGEDINFQNLCGSATKMYNMQMRQNRIKEIKQ